jgi:hypothetical protein
MAKEPDPEASQPDDADELPREVVDEAERLTRLAREVANEDEADTYREARDELLADTDFTARVREDDRDTLVLYPEEWVVGGTVHPDRVDDVDRGIERPLEGPGASEDWDTVEEHNRAVADRVATEHGSVHGQNAHALADFASNHYAKPIDDLTREERAEFLSEYFVRNAFPSDDQKAVVEESVQFAVAVADDESTGVER